MTNLVDIVSPAKRSIMMSGIRATDTQPELLVRSMLHRLGYRFRLHRKDLLGKPDIVLPRHNVVIFVHGCFWHGHDDCHLFRLPRSRTEFWEQKIGTNKVRDSRNMEAIRSVGWRAIIIWECALKGRWALPKECLEVAVQKAISPIDSPSEIFGNINTTKSDAGR